MNNKKTLFWNKKYFKTFEMCGDSWQYCTNNLFLFWGLYTCPCLQYLSILVLYIFFACSCISLFGISLFLCKNFFLIKRSMFPNTRMHIYSWALYCVVNVSLLLLFLGLHSHMSHDRCSKVLWEKWAQLCAVSALGLFQIYGI